VSDAQLHGRAAKLMMILTTTIVLFVRQQKFILNLPEKNQGVYVLLDGMPRLPCVNTPAMQAPIFVTYFYKRPFCIVRFCSVDFAQCTHPAYRAYAH
jgi:hypothetical protein